MSLHYVLSSTNGKAVLRVCMERGMGCRVLHTSQKLNTRAITVQVARLKHA